MVAERNLARQRQSPRNILRAFHLFRGSNRQAGDGARSAAALAAFELQRRDPTAGRNRRGQTDGDLRAPSVPRGRHWLDHASPQLQTTLTNRLRQILESLDGSAEPLEDAQQ